MFESVLSSTTISDSSSFDTAHTYNNCGAVYFKQGNYKKAYEMALKLHPFEQSRLSMYQENLENTKRKLEQATVAFE
jgi:hypothetical protein